MGAIASWLRLSFVALVALLATCCLPAKTPLSHEINSVVVLAVPDPDSFSGYHTLCSGVFVSKNEILTAGHCVVAVREMTKKDEVLIRLSGHDETYSGFIDSLDEDHDLGTIFAVGLPNHPWVKVALDRPQVGSMVTVVGHPRGLGWSVARGYVSAYRGVEFAMPDLWGPWMQLEVPVSGGNSGGPAFNEEGQLVGICSFHMQSVNGMSFFVPVENIRTHLRMK